MFGRVSDSLGPQNPQVADGRWGIKTSTAKIEYIEEQVNTNQLYKQVRKEREKVEHMV